jgi:transposase
MSTRFVNVDRCTPMLLPPDLREWVADDDLAHFVLEAVESLDLGLAAVNARGTGSEQYPPSMMLAVLVYSYASGIFSSRRIEQATYRHLSVRYLSGNTHPDHDTIAKFRRENTRLIESVFVQVLELAREMGLLRLGIVSLDGTKVRANASKRATWTHAEMQQELAALRQPVEQLLAQAEQADAMEGDDGTRLPPDLACRQSRRAQLEAARQRLAERTRQRAAQRQAEQDHPPDQPGRPPRRLPSEPGPTDRVNTTDPDSGLMPTAREGFVQGYNAQLAVSTDSGLIVAARVTDEPCDRRQLAPTVAAIPASLGCPTAVLADTGFDNQRQIAHVERHGRTVVYCSPQSARRQPPSGWQPRGHQRRTAEARARMRARLESSAGRALYRLRAITVEPVIGILKSVLGFRQFHLRGLGKVQAEWQLLALAFNCRRLAKHSRVS